MTASTGPGAGRGETPADICGALREAIVTGEYVPGQRLVEADLCTRFGASRNAVRTALVQLSAEGLTERVHHRGARVRAVPLGEAVEIMEVRMVLEELSAARAAARITVEQAARLATLGEGLRAAVRTGDLPRYARLDAELHALIRVCGGHGTARTVVDRLEGHVARHRFRLILNPSRLSSSLAEHLAIIQAVRSGDEEEAARALRAHLSSVLAVLSAGH